jgi:hypothetical protein
MTRKTSTVAERRRSHAFYQHVLEVLVARRAPFLLGGAYALEHHTGVTRHVKDVDVFVRPADRDHVLAVLADAGCRTELTSPVWLAKARRGADYADVIFSSGNGIAEVDDAWFAHAEEGCVRGLSVRMCPPEEMIWSKAYVMERERYDGADVAHLIRACGGRMDWARLVARFGTHWPVLLSHLVLFGFVYPTEHGAVPSAVMDELLGRLEHPRHLDAPEDRVCRGTLLSKRQYRIDIERWGYRDGRLPPDGRMSSAEAAGLDRER